jgi:hypothetical protein
VEVEAGRGAAGNADYRDIVRTSLILDARYMALLLPVRYRTTSGGREHAIHAYERTRNQLDAIYASQGLGWERAATWRSAAYRAIPADQRARQRRHGAGVPGPVGWRAACSGEGHPG